jgi:hypothetical protein
VSAQLSLFPSTPGCQELPRIDIRRLFETLYGSSAMPEIFRVGEPEDVDVVLSPQRPQLRKGRVIYDSWAEENAWVKFRTTPHAGHVLSNITALVQQNFLVTSARKRKRMVNAEHANIDEFRKASTVATRLTQRLESVMSMVKTKSNSYTRNPSEKALPTTENGVFVVSTRYRSTRKLEKRTCCRGRSRWYNGVE